MRTALDHANEQPGVLEHPEMPAERRLRHVEAAGGLADRGGSERETLDDSTADRMSERLKRTVSHLANNLLLHSLAPATQEVHPAARSNKSGFHRRIRAGWPPGLLPAEAKYLQSESFCIHSRNDLRPGGPVVLLRGLAATTGSRRGFPAASRAGSTRDARKAGGRAATTDADLQVLLRERRDSNPRPPA